MVSDKNGIALQKAARCPERKSNLSLLVLSSFYTTIRSAIYVNKLLDRNKHRNSNWLFKLSVRTLTFATLRQTLNRICLYYVDARLDIVYIFYAHSIRTGVEKSAVLLLSRSLLNFFFTILEMPQRG